jgi:hypothetical protein
MSNEYYILIDRQEQPSRLNAVTMWRLTFQGLMSNRIVEMTVDRSYRNFHRSGWDHVVTASSPWGVYNTLRLTEKTTRRGVPVVSADSAAEIIYRCADHAEALALAEASLRHNTPVERFEQLFD